MPNSQNAQYGSMAGGIAGMYFGPIGSMIGSAAGGMIGGMFGGADKGPDFSGMQDIINQRQAQITAFGNSLEAARNNVLNNYKDLQTNTMARFAPAFEAKLGARGISASSGAYASGVGQEAAGLQGQYDMVNANMTESNLNTVGQMQSQLFGPQYQLAENKAMLPYAQQQSSSAASGKMASTLTSAMSSWAGSSGSATGGQVAPSSQPGYRSFNQESQDAAYQASGGDSSW